MSQQNKEQQKKLLTEIMEADQKNGLYDNHIGDTNKMVTAVKWLQMKMATSSPQEMVENINVWFKEAKQMEKEQHQETFKQSRQAKIFEEGMPPVWESFEQYYNETYGK